MDNTFSVEERQQGNWVSLPAFNDNFLYLENVNAAFASLGTDWGDFSGQVGLRLENTRIRTEVNSTGRVNDQNYLNLFPSVFLNYSFNDRQSVQLSYSRRLSRPWSRMLIPFVDFDDPRSQFTDNPELRPESSNSYEAGYLHHWETGSLLTSFYYRYRTDVIERITDQSEGITRILPINLATEEARGIELSVDQKIANALTVTGNTNLFRSHSDGTYQDQVFNSEAEIFQGRMRLRWDIAKGWKYEVSMRHRGPHKTTQGRCEGMTMIDTGLATEFNEGRAVLTLNVRDLLDAQNFSNTVTTDGNQISTSIPKGSSAGLHVQLPSAFSTFFGNEQRSAESRENY